MGITSQRRNHQAAQRLKAQRLTAPGAASPQTSITQELQALRAERDQLVAQAASVDPGWSSKRGAKARVEAVVKERDDLMVEIAQLRKLLNGESLELLEEQEAEVAAGRELIAAGEKAIAELQEALKAKSAACDAAEKEVAKLTAANEKLKEQLKGAGGKRVQALKDRVAELEAQLKGTPAPESPDPEKADTQPELKKPEPTPAAEPK